MSDPTDHMLGSIIKLTDLNLGDWKYDILTSEETLSSLNSTQQSDFKACRSKLAANICSTLSEGHHAIIEVSSTIIQPYDVKAIYDKLLSELKAKTINSRMFATQKMLALRRGDTGHENETYSDFANRCISQGNALKNLLALGSKFTEVQVTMGKSVLSDIGYVTAVYEAGYSAKDLVDELVVSMIIVGLGFGTEESELRRTLTVVGMQSLKELIERLRNMDTMAQSEKNAKDMSSNVDNALSARAKDQKQKSSAKISTKQCTNHPNANSHTTEECSLTKARKGKEAKKKEKAKKAKAKVATASSNSNSDAEPSDTTDLDNRKPPKACAQMAKASVSRLPSHSSDKLTNTSWNTDSGATCHMTSNRHWLHNLKLSNVTIQITDDRDLAAAGEGTVVFQPIIDGWPAQSLVFEHILYIPQLKHNLFSVFGAMEELRNLEFQAKGKRLKFIQDDEVLLAGTIQDACGYLDGYMLSKHKTAMVTRIPYSLLHQRLGHISKGRMETLITKDLANGVVVDKKSNMPDICEHCVAGKQYCDPFPKAAEHCSNETGRLIHSDLYGPLPKTPNGWQYWITFVNDYSRYKHVYLLKKKSDAFARLKEYVAEVETKFGVKVKELGDDKGGEYISNEMAAWYKEHSIIRHHTICATP
ncbi:hypothetical protein FRB98_009677 [Tulasnella sp. 332]|nr:hypothetical protein FRB98_009677 [Tulasnella sp. 332]